MTRREKALTVFIVVVALVCVWLAFQIDPRHEPDPGLPAAGQITVPVTQPVADLDGEDVR